MSSYSEMFTEMQPDHDPRHIEAWIRTEHATLDGVSWKELKRLSGLAAEQTKTDPILAERLARSFGL